MTRSNTSSKGRYTHLILLILSSRITLVLLFLAVLAWPLPNEARLVYTDAEPFPTVAGNLLLDVNVYDVARPALVALSVEETKLGILEETNGDKSFSKGLKEALIANHKAGTPTGAEMETKDGQIVINVQVTAYGWGEPNNLDATGRRLKEGIIALSPDLVKKLGLKIGDKVRLEKHGVFEYRDHMAKRWRDRVDIFIDAPSKEVMKFGLRKDRLIISKVEG